MVPTPEVEMFERFTSDARDVMVRAQEESRALHSGYIGTEHLLLALFRVAVTADLLEAAGVSEDRFRATLFEGEASERRSLPFTPRAKRVLERALRESIRIGTGSIQPEHLLLGVVKDDDGKARRFLADARVNTTELLAAIEASLPPARAGHTVLSAGVVERLTYAQAAARTIRASTELRAHTAPAPTCPGCSADLVAHLKVRSVDAIDDDGARIPIQLVYCGACGRTITSHDGGGDARRAAEG